MFTESGLLIFNYFKEGLPCGIPPHSSSSSPDLPSNSLYPPSLLRSVSEPDGDSYPDGMDSCGSSDDDSGFQISTGIKMDDSYDFYQSVIKSFFPSPEKKSSLRKDGYQDLPDIPDLSSKDSTLKATPSSVFPDKIDSATLAKIEDFELFAKLKLETSKKT